MEKILLMVFVVLMTNTAEAADKIKKPPAKKYTHQKLDLTIGQNYTKDTTEYNKMTKTYLENSELKNDEGLSVQPEFRIVGDQTYSGKDNIEKAKEFKLKFKYGF